MTTLQIPASRIYQNHHLDSTRWDAYVPRADDIIVSTAYKAGTTWTLAIVRELIAHTMQQRGVTDPTHYPAPDSKSAIWPDLRIGGPIHELKTHLEDQPHRRFLKSHLALDGLPIYDQVNYLVVLRDPRDVFMSFWNHYEAYTDFTYGLYNDTPGRRGNALPRCPTDLHELWQMWIGRGWFEWEHEGYPFWGNMHHAQSWWDQRHRSNILLVHYANMVADPSREIHKIADFLDIAVTDETVAKVVDYTSIDAMRQRALADHTSVDFWRMWRNGAKTFFNQGTNGRWRDVLTDEELAMYEATKAKVLTAQCAHWLEFGYESQAEPLLSVVAA